MRLPRFAVLAHCVVMCSTGHLLAQTNRPAPQRDVFVVGADTAFGDPLLGFKPTRVDYTNTPMDLAGRRELIRALLMEQGFAHRTLPLGAQDCLCMRTGGSRWTARH